MRTLATLLLAFVLAPAFAQTPCDGADHTILAGNYYYNPASLTINAGETVAWINEGGFHDVNGDISVLTGMSYGNPEAFSLPSVSGSAMGVCMGTQTFTVPGTYEYDCSIGSHAANGMVGTITVVAPPSGCNDMAACNYDAAATSDVDCIYVDTDYDLTQGVLIGIPFGQFDMDTTATCAVQPINDNLVQMDLTAGQQATFVVDDAVIAYFDAAVASGTVSQTDADFFLNLMQNATLSFCGDTMFANLPVFGEVTSAWTGSHWLITPINYYIAPVSTVPVGCGDPAAENFDLCVINEPTMCEYAAAGCNDPLACNYDENGTGTEDCNYFDTELFTLEENDFIGLIDFEDCANGYPGAYSLPVPLGQDTAGGPLFFTLFDEVEAFLIEFGFEIAAQDLSTVTMSVCDTVLNYNSLVLGDIDMIWDGTGFPNEFYGSFVVPESSLPIGCADEEACNFDPCVHPFVEEGCEYLDIGTLEGDTIVEAGGTLTLTATPGAGNGFEWSSNCASIEDDNEVVTITATEDCEVCYLEFNSDSCAAELCLNISVITSVDENGRLPWQFMPNPAADALRVVWGGEAAVFEVFDLNGRRVHTATIYRGVTTLDLSALQPGLYLAGPQGSELQRLAIQR